MRATTAFVKALVFALPPRSPVRTLSTLSVSAIARRRRCASGCIFTCSSISPAASSSDDGIGDALAGDVGRRAVHRLEDRGVGADIGAGREAEPADQAGDLVGEDVAEEVGRDQHVELPGVEHELHRAGIDDAVVAVDAALISPRRSSAGLEEEAGQRLQHVGLVDDGDLLAAVALRAYSKA